MVSIFFCIKDKLNSKEKFIIFSCPNSKALKYGNFLNYPYSHYDVWNRKLLKYNSEYDYYPRGRVIYNINEDCYYIYFDRCIRNKRVILDKYKDKKYKVLMDYHYQCHICNKNYLI